MKIRNWRTGLLVLLLSSTFASAGEMADMKLKGPIKGTAYLGGSFSEEMLAKQGYVEEEFILSGTATSYTIEGDFPEDGSASASVADSAAYTTRLLVRRPADVDKFNGTVVVEWLNG